MPAVDPCDCRPRLAAGGWRAERKARPAQPRTASRVESGVARGACGGERGSSLPAEHEAMFVHTARGGVVPTLVHKTHTEQKLPLPFFD